MSSSGILKSSLAKKYAMALTGLFLCSFLVGHLLGNLQLFVPGVEGQTAFNEYALFMTTFPLVKILSYLTYASVLFHVVDGFVLVVQNRKARPARYAVEKGLSQFRMEQPQHGGARHDCVGVHRDPHAELLVADALR